jgi:hypothetical protein
MHEIEYLESTGTQWIDTEYTPNLDTKWVLNGQFTRSDINSAHGAYTSDFRIFYGLLSAK